MIHSKEEWRPSILAGTGSARANPDGFQQHHTLLQKWKVILAFSVDVKPEMEFQIYVLKCFVKHFTGNRNAFAFYQNSRNSLFLSSLSDPIFFMDVVQRG